MMCIHSSKIVNEYEMRMREEWVWDERWSQSTLLKITQWSNGQLKRAEFGEKEDLLLDKFKEKDWSIIKNDWEQNKTWIIVILVKKGVRMSTLKGKAVSACQ